MKEVKPIGFIKDVGWICSKGICTGWTDWGWWNTRIKTVNKQHEQHFKMDKTKIVYHVKINNNENGCVIHTYYLNASDVLKYKKIEVLQQKGDELICRATQSNLTVTVDPVAVLIQSDKYAQAVNNSNTANKRNVLRKIFI